MVSYASHLIPPHPTPPEGLRGQESAGLSTCADIDKAKARHTREAPLVALQSHALPGTHYRGHPGPHGALAVSMLWTAAELFSDTSPTWRPAVQRKGWPYWHVPVTPAGGAWWHMPLIQVLQA